MNGEKLYEAIGMIDDKYLAGLDAYEKKRRRILPAYLVTGIAAAACVGIIAAGSLILPKLTGGPEVVSFTTASETSVSETTAPAASPTETSAPDTGTSEVTCKPETSVPVIVPDTEPSDTGVPDTEPPDTSVPDTEPIDTSAPAIVTPDPDDDDIDDDDKPDDPLPYEDDNPAGGGAVETAYGTPVLPLTLLNADSDITAGRKITFDYSEWDVNDFYPDIGVTDEYILTNSSAEDKEVTVVYPFASQGSLCDIYIPTLTVNGEIVEQTMRAGSMPEDHLGLDSNERKHYALYGWDRYKELLENGTYTDRALNYTFDYGDRPLTVYRFTEKVTDGENKPKTGGKTAVSFNYDPEKTKVVLFGLGNSFKDRETGRTFWLVGDPAYIIVSGEDITDIIYDYNHFKKKNDIEEQENLENMPEFVRYETDYDHIMRELLSYKLDVFNNESSSGKYFPTDFEGFYLAYCEYLENRGAFSGGSEFCDQLYEAYWLSLEFHYSERVFYVIAQVTIPAGGSVNVTATMKNNLASPDFCALAFGTVHGYDLATTLGSNLEFTEISAEIKNYSSLDVTNENFGFDLENGVTKVKLDPGVDRYYIEAKKLLTGRP